MTKAYYVYMMTNKRNSVLYTGVTGDLERRVFEHKNKIVPGFTQRYNATKLVYFESGGDVAGAIAREKQIKGWLRSKKNTLVASINAEWKDLSCGWFGDPSASPQDDTTAPVILSAAKDPGHQESKP